MNSFAMLNLPEESKKDIEFYLDKNVVDKFNYMGLPPMNSGYTIWLSPKDLINLLEKYGIKVNINDFNKEEKVNKQETKNVKEKEEHKDIKNNKQKEKQKEIKKDDDEDLSSLGIQNKKEENFLRLV